MLIELSGMLIQGGLMLFCVELLIVEMGSLEEEGLILILTNI